MGTLIFELSGQHLKLSEFFKLQLRGLGFVNRELTKKLWACSTRLLLAIQLICQWNNGGATAEDISICMSETACIAPQ